MRPEVIDVIREWYPTHLADRRRVLEFGSYDVNGSPRAIFTGDHVYVGIDMRDGPGVDVVADFQDLSVGGEADVILCIDTLEHDESFWLTLDQVRAALRPGGLFVLSVPTIHYNVYHGYPDDYWRFTSSAFDRVLLEGFDVIDRREITTDGAKGADTIVAIARRRP